MTRSIDTCPHCEGAGGRREEECPTHGIGADLERQSQFYANWNARQDGKPLPYPDANPLVPRRPGTMRGGGEGI